MTDPRDAETIEWDSGNESELAAHGIYPNEVSSSGETGRQFSQTEKTVRVISNWWAGPMADDLCL